MRSHQLLSTLKYGCVLALNLINRRQLASGLILTILTLTILSGALTAYFLFGHAPLTVRSDVKQLSAAKFSGQLTEADRSVDSRPTAARVDSFTQAKINETYGHLPLQFTANAGQVASQIKFSARGQGYGLFLTPTEAVLDLSKPRAHYHREQPSSDKSEKETGPERKEVAGNSALRMRLEGANREPTVSGEDELPGKVNYLLGKDPSAWRTDIRTYRKVLYKDVYQGIDLLYYGNQQQLEYDFVLAPDADPAAIKIDFQGIKKLALDERGDLSLKTAAGDLHLHRPSVYQEVNGERREIASRYLIKDQRQVGFKVGDYDRSQPLVIDPVLIYSTYLGGTDSEQGLGIAVDAAGNSYVTGETYSTDFPVVGALQSASGSDHDLDVFVTKFNPAGSAIVYSTFIGGNGADSGNSIALDLAGNAYVAGATSSSNFPTVNALHTSLSGSTDAFVAELNATGSALIYSTYLGGAGYDNGYGIAVDGSGQAYVTGLTYSTDFPTTNAFQAGRSGNSLFKSINGAGSWSASDSGLTASNVADLIYDPTNPSVLYAATDTGVFKSTNSGGNWTMTGQLGQPVKQIAINPANPAVLYAATYPGLYKSTNGGSSWALSNNSRFGEYFLSVAIDPATPATIYAGSFSSLVYKSTDDGNTWSTSNINNVFAIYNFAINPTTPSTIYAGTDRGVYKSTNGGSTWVLSSTGMTLRPDAIYDLLIDANSPATLYAAASFGLYKSTDGGGHWSPIGAGVLSTPVNAVTLDPANSSIIYAACSGGKVFKSTDGGINWSETDTGLRHTTISVLTVDPANASTLYAGTSSGSDVFITKLGAGGSAQIYSTYLGGLQGDVGYGIAVDAGGTACVTGSTLSDNFPLANALQIVKGDIFTHDAFVTKINSTGSALDYSTYLGGDGDDVGFGIALDTSGNVYLTGYTSSSNFPTAQALQASKNPSLSSTYDAFVTKLKPDGSAFVYSTYLGGKGDDMGEAIAVDSSGNSYITGTTNSTDFPTASAVQATIGGFKGMDAFISKLNAAGSALVHSTYLGGSDDDAGYGIALDPAGNAYVTGTTISTNFPTANAVKAAHPSALDYDTFVVKVGTLIDLTVTLSASTNPVMAGNNLTYLATVVNKGPSRATDVTLTDNLPSGVTLVSATPSQGSCNASNPITCALGQLESGAAATITIVVTTGSAGNISNTVNVNGAEPEFNTNDNSATLNTGVSSRPSIAGRVTDSNGQGISGVTLTLSGAQSTTTQTDSDGFYQFAELPAGGTYVVTPTKSNLSIDPSSQTFNALGADQTANFVASTCTYSIALVSQNFSAAGGPGSVSVTSLHDCPWTAVSSAGWITITSGASGVGSGTVSFTVSSTTAPRAGHITIAGKNFAVYQEFNSCGAPAFSVASYNLQDNPTEVRVGDLNGDGRPDVALVTNALSGGGIRTSVLLNNGAGGFTTSDFDTGLGVPQGFVLGDFNGDGKPDIAMTSYNYPNVRIFYNNGNGGFGQSNANIPFTSQGQSPLTRALFTADLNHDGKADLIVHTPGSDSIQVLLGNGSGGFTQQAPINVSAIDIPTGIVDVNGDGAPDLIFSGGRSNSRPISVRLGDGAGGFGTPIVSSGVGVTAYVAAADFDGDGILDIAASTVIPAPDSTPSNPKFTNAVSILTGDGHGHFAIKSSLNTGNSSPNIAVSDFNSDGKSDIALIRGGGNVTIVLGDGAGGLGTIVQVNIGASDLTGGNFSIAAADFNGDGKPDLVAADYSSGAEVLRNSCQGAAAISGHITDSRNSRGLAGVTVTLGGAPATTTQTDDGGNFFFSNLTTGANYVVTPTRDSFRFNPANVSVNNLAGTQTANFVGTPITVQFTSQDYVVNEEAGSIQIGVRRTGDLSGVSTVNYATMDGTASARTDYTSAFGTLRFGPGESLKSFTVLITNDNIVEGWESLTLSLSNPTGAIFDSPTGGQPITSLLEIRDNDNSPPSSNPLDDAQFFVREQYVDFLNREPDAGGLGYWSNEIVRCGDDALCLRDRRVGVADAFFFEPEFQQTGAYIYRIYKAALGRKPLYAQFTSDRGRVVAGSNLDQSKTDFVLDFVQRDAFLQLYPRGISAEMFVDTLLNSIKQNSGLDLSARRSALISLYDGTDNGRAAILRQVADSAAFIDAEYNNSFVLMEYFGYLRRDADEGGFNFWLSQVNKFPQRNVSIQHAMACSFITSAEYQTRFSSVVTHTNRECPQ